MRRAQKLLWRALASVPLWATSLFGHEAAEPLPGWEGPLLDSLERPSTSFLGRVLDAEPRWQIGLLHEDPPRALVEEITFGPSQARWLPFVRLDARLLEDEQRLVRFPATCDSLAAGLCWRVAARVELRLLGSFTVMRTEPGMFHARESALELHYTLRF